LSARREHGVLCADATVMQRSDLRDSMGFSRPQPNDVPGGADRPSFADPLFSADGGEPPVFSGESSAVPDADAVGYWTLSRMPLTSLVFALPLVLAYEGGVLALGRGSPRNGADVWLRQLLDSAGFGAYFLLPALTVIGLLAWQHIEYDRWRFSAAVLAGMAVECLLWAAALIGVARLQGRFWPLAADLGGEGVFARLVAFCGAGLYEEVLFRLLLLPLLAWCAARIGFSPTASGVLALVGSSLLFSLAHYVGPLGDQFAVYSFTFRFLAGLFFALLFLIRGFGIVAGTHAIYDILVGIV
jgi:membrane protease YdiL (CAAX protease family)